MIGRMHSIAAVLGVIAVAVAAILRRLLGTTADRHNVALLARRHDLDAETAARLYELARRDGFGSAWGEVIEHPTPVDRRHRTATKSRTRKLVDRRRA